MVWAKSHLPREKVWTKSRLLPEKMRAKSHLPLEEVRTGSYLPLEMVQALRELLGEGKQPRSVVTARAANAPG